MDVIVKRLRFEVDFLDTSAGFHSIILASQSLHRQTSGQLSCII
jgi:hypothetical protein